MCGRSGLHEQKHVAMRTNIKSENADLIILLFQMDMKSVGTFYYESFVSVIFIYGTSFCSCHWMKVNFDLALNCLPIHYIFTQTVTASCPLFTRNPLPERVQSNLTTLEWGVCPCLTQLYWWWRYIYRIYYIKINNMFRPFKWPSSGWDWKT